MKKKFTLTRACIWIFSTAVLLNALAFLGIKGYVYWKREGLVNYRVPIKTIVQTGPQKEALKTTYLAEILGLSFDEPTLSSQFDLKEAKTKLLSSPVIKEAEITFKEPGVLYVDYTVRQPVCFLHDFENVALDNEKVPFPVTPFFTPKRLPEIYLGLEEDILWNRPIKGEKITLAFELLHILKGPILCDLFNVKRIDVSLAFEKSYGRREIVLLTEDECVFTHKEREIHFIYPRILRLSRKEYLQELSNYLKLREQLLQKEQIKLDLPLEEQQCVRYPRKVIDFRIPQLAFVDEEIEERL